jgi:glycosyltransferase involved in cell wall biosynthesis
MRRPLIIGPLIAAPSPPRSFDPILRLPSASALAERLKPTRILKSAARRAADYLDRTRFAVSKAALILVGMEEARRQVPDQFKRLCVPITWSGVEHQYFVPPDRRADSRPLKLLFVGRLVPYKGAELLLRAAHLARQRCPLELRIIGDGDADYVEFLKKLTHDLGLAHSVRFEKPIARPELLRHYQSADAFCFPTLADTYGVSLLEAMSCGCAAIASDTGGPTEILNDDCGIRIPLTNPERYVQEYADAIVTIATNPELRLKLASNARRHVLREHDWDRIGERLLQIYDMFTARLNIGAH